MNTIKNKHNDRKFSLLLIILLVVQYLVPSEIAFLLNVFILITLSIKFKGIPKKIMPNFNLLLLLVVYLSVVTFISMFVSVINYRDIIRDIFYLLNGVCALLLGAFLSFRGLEFHKFANSFIAASLILLFKFWFEFFTKNIMNVYQLSTNSIEMWRETIGHGSLFSILCLAIIFSRIIPVDKRLNKWIQVSYCILAVAQFAITFSRTSIVLLCILLLFFNMKSISRTSMKKIIVLFIMVCSGAFLYNYFKDNLLVQSFILKISKSFTELSVGNDYSNIASIQRNWRGYEVFSAIKEWKESTLYNQIFEFGLGKKIFVGQVSILVDPNSNGWIPVLHNGYFTILIKGGLVGFIIYIFYYIFSFISGVFIYFKDKDEFSLYFCGAIVGLAITTIFLNGLFRDSINFSLIYFVGFVGNMIIQPTALKRE